MQLKNEIKGDVLTVTFAGELDEHIADPVKEKLDSLFTNPKITKIVFNMSELTFMDSTGLGIIIGRYKKLKGTNKQIFIARPSPGIDKLLKLSGIYEIIRKI